MSLFDHLHQHLFDQLFSLDEASRQQLAEIARRRGVPEEIIREILQEGIRVGMTLGAAHPIDVKTLVERVLFRQGAQSVTLQIRRWPNDEAGHLDIRVVEIQKAEDQ